MTEAMAATEAPETTGQVTEGVERLESLAQELDAALTRLSKKAQSVLIEQNAVPSDGTTLEAARLVASPLSERIDAVADRITGHITRVNDLRDRLDA